MKLVLLYNYKLLLILVLAVGLRLSVIDQSLWLDEAIGALAVRDNSYLEILTEYIKADFHPPLYYLILKFWTNIFGYSELALRSLSVLFGTATVYLVYLISLTIKPGKKFFPTLAALLVATSQLHVYYSQEARMYAMAAFFAALSVFSFTKVLQKTNKKNSSLFWWVLFSVSVAALLFTDYVPVFLLPSFGVFAILTSKNKRWWVKFFVSFLPLVILGVIWLPTFIVQAKGGSWLVSILPAWKQAGGGPNTKQAILVWMKFVFGRVSLTNKFAYYFLVGISSIPFVFLLIRSINKRKNILLIWLWLVLPLFLGYVTSFLFPALIYFRVLYVLPALYLITAYGVSEIANPKVKKLFVCLLLTINFVSLGIYYFDQNQQREQWRQAISFIEKSAKKNDIVIFEYPQPFSPYRWYESGKVEAVGVTNSVSADHEKTRKITLESTENFEGVYHFEYLRDLSDPERIVEATLVESGFQTGEVVGDFPGVGQVSYWSKSINE